MLRLMAEGPHPQDTADTAAQHRGQKQRLFGDAPRPPFGLPLVNSHQGEPRQVHHRQIQRQQLPKLFRHPDASLLVFSPV